MGLPFFPLKGLAAEGVGPLFFVGVAGAEFDWRCCPTGLVESDLLTGACAAFETAFRHLSNLDSIAATLATIGLGS